MGFPGGSEGKEFACNAGYSGSVSRLGRFPGEGHGKPTPVLLPGKFHGQRCLEGSSSWGHKESDKTKRLTRLLSSKSTVEKLLKFLKTFKVYRKHNDTDTYLNITDAKRSFLFQIFESF